MSINLYEKFTPEQIEAFSQAVLAYTLSKHSLVGTGHLLLGLSRQGQNKSVFGNEVINPDSTFILLPGIAAQTLQAVNVSMSDIENVFDDILSQSSRETIDPSTQAKSAISKVFTSENREIIAPPGKAYLTRSLVPLSSRCLHVFALAWKKAQQAGFVSMTTGHILLALIQGGKEIFDGSPSDAFRVLGLLKVDLLAVENQVTHLLNEKG
ncbi:MAG TPA: hypothetical protein IGS53_16385 [Leptolyngbyaceae cyanobacterium M33_DOE_097]|uniref:Clp R domain-containing protein n=1 Tax=Oscillatoriales cyanobacterium SpSt-418 TaxID=2282169 RepID=A0A7C3PK78_9CYAN|nr:hypothetical protein [Leptolyngbyaceae cyanobacterium M33_DOE_097]